MIELRALSFSYGPQRILHDVSFTAGDGEVIGILGTNGTGKSTLITCINRVRKPDSGDVLIDGQAVSAMDRNTIARKIAYVPQHWDSPSVSVFDSILLGRRPYMRFGASREDIALCRAVIEQMDLGKLQLRNLDELSGGERQKVMLARALVQNPRVMLLDEPTSSLDPHNQYGMMAEILRMARTKGLIVLVVLHDLNLALSYCDRFFFMKNGTGIRYCTLDEIDSGLIADTYDVKADIAEVRGRRFILIDKEAEHGYPGTLA